MQDLWRLSAAELAALIRSKKVSAKEAATAGLARLDAVNPKINAVVDHRPEDVLAQASAVDAAIGRGEDAGPLGGVPVTVKVNIDQEGFATTNGLKLQRDAIAKSNNPVIDNLRKSGAVILGRTNCPAFSYRWFTSNLIHGDTKNPRDPSITPGGSSGGAGAAVAAGIGHIAHGTDIAGSIRYPAYACGVHGLRPTLGRIPAFNAALARTADRAADQRRLGPAGAHRRRYQDRAGRDVGERLSRSLVGAGAARRAGDAQARRDVPQSRRPRSGARSRGRRSPTPASGSSGPAGSSRRFPARRRCARPPICRPNSGLATAMRHSWKWPSAKAIPARWPACAATAPRCIRSTLSKALTRRATLTREWLAFLENYAVLLMPVSGELPFPDQLDRKDEASFARVWHAQLPQIAIPFMGLPGLNGLDRPGRARARRRATGFRPLPRGFVPCCRRGIEAGGTPSAAIDPAD